MKNYICIDGVKTKLSCETAETLKQQFGTEKPKELRHGDYGWAYGKWWCAEYDFGAGNIRIAYTYPSASPTQSGIKYLLDAPDYEYHGNHIDDLERNSKDLEEFEKQVDGNGIIRTRIVCNNKIEIHNTYKYATATLDEATEIAQAILQEVATAKRKAEKDC